MSKEVRHREPFSGEDDIKLVMLVRIYGTNNWKRIANEFKNRNPRQCKDRWEYFICPSMNKNPWTKEEEDILVQKYQEYGSRWKVIAKFLPNRTHINVRNKMNKILRHEEKSSKQSPEQETKCSPQVQELGTVNACPKKPQDITSFDDIFEISSFDVFDETEDFVSFF